MRKLMEKIKNDLREFNSNAEYSIATSEYSGHEYIQITDNKPIYLCEHLIKGCSISAYATQNKVYICIYKNKKTK